MVETEDFEFKPITEGLGFHKQKSSAPTEPAPTGNRPLSSLPLAGHSYAKPGAVNKGIHPTLNRVASSAATSVPASMPGISAKKPAAGTSTTFGRTTAAADVRREVEKAIEQQTQAAARARSSQLLSALPAAILFDAIIVVGLACLFTVVVLLVADVDFLTVITSARTDFMTAAALGVLVFAVLELYTVVFRSIFGFTLGEWAFDAQLGTEDQRKSASFPLRVVVRAFVTAITGFVVLPIASMISGKDIAGKISGVSLHRA